MDGSSVVTWEYIVAADRFAFDDDLGVRDTWSIGKYIRELVVPEDAHLVANTLLEAIAPASAVHGHFEHRVRRLGVVSVCYSVIKQGDTIVKLVGAVRARLGGR